MGRKPNGASSIYRGSDGKWHGRVTVGVKDDGTLDRRHVKRKTQAEVIRAVRGLERGKLPADSFTVIAARSLGLPLTEDLVPTAR